jgi:hypothetical protein
MKNNSDNSPKVNIVLLQDIEIESLKSELRNLEILIGEITSEKLELEKLLSAFQHRHTLELGEIILEILKLRKIKFKDDKVRFEETENDERQYNEQVIFEKQKIVQKLNEEQKTELKKKFREATFLCHPDKISDEFKNIAEEIFNELRTAYELNDLIKVTEILNDLKKGGFTAKSDSVSEKELLKTSIIKLQKEIDFLKSQILEIKKSDTYLIILEIKNWDEYFHRTKVDLIRELDELKKEIIIEKNENIESITSNFQNDKSEKKSNFWSKIKSFLFDR